jgi:two-component system, NtrC family, response regulator AtoC
MDKNKTHNTDRENTTNVLIADDDQNFSRLVLEMLARKAIRGHLVHDRRGIIELIDRDRCNLVILGERLNLSVLSADPRQDNLDLVRKIRTSRPELPVIIVSEIVNDAGLVMPGQVQYLAGRATEAIRRGCYDFLIKPVNQHRLEMILDTLLPNHNYSTLITQHDGTACIYQIVGSDAKMAQTVGLAMKIAPTSAPVLICGESGTGKELIARLIHHKSKRSQGPYVRVNCAALSDSLLESELFGHEKGAFTGAYTQHKGRFELASGGTLLLDEITETPLKFQAKLLRVLEQQEFERVGGNENVRVDVRIISTTNKDLLAEVHQCRFRQDLYYRLAAVRLHLLPLRQRKDDLRELIWHFVNMYSHESQRYITELDPDMLNIFSKYHWPGNIRQLRNVVRTSLIFGAGRILSLADVSWLFDELQPLPQYKISDYSNMPECQSAELSKNEDEGQSLEQIERRAILDALHRSGGNRTKAAKVLGISDRTLRDKVHRYHRQGCLQTA